MKTILFILFIFSFCLLKAQVYINPNSSSAIEDGSIDNPFKSFDKVRFATGQTYLIKRNTEMIVTKAIFIRPNNITIKTYGEGSNPVIIANVNSRTKIFDVSLTANFYMRDIIAMAKDTALTVVNIQGSCNATLINCKFSNAFYGVRNINSRNKVIIDSCEISNIQQDGIYFNGVDSVFIKNTYIHNVNQAYFKNKTEQGSYGDAIQLDAAKFFYITNNILDRSDTGNKFCFITGSGNCPGSIFENNKCIGNPNLGSCIYLIGTNGLIIRYNLFKNGQNGIYGNDLNSKIYYNIFDGITNMVLSHATRSKVEFYNNTVVNCKTGLSSWSDTLVVKNNIFYNVNLPFQSRILYENNNIFYPPYNTTKSFIGEPLLNTDYSPMDNSIAINNGDALNIPQKDYLGNIFSGKRTIGAIQYIPIKKDAFLTIQIYSDSIETKTYKVELINTTVIKNTENTKGIFIKE